jgi:hypothetical protein
MAKLTIAQKRTLSSALQSLDRAIAFIESNRVAICVATEVNAATAQGPNEYRAKEPHRSQDYVGRDDSKWTIDWVNQLSPIDKGIGSDLVSIYTARSTLRNFLAPEF